jgi:hypothetical protein
LLKTWLMTTEANFPLQQLCLKPSLYGRFSLDHLWPLLGDHQGCRDRIVGEFASVYHLHTFRLSPSVPLRRAQNMQAIGEEFCRENSF